MKKALKLSTAYFQDSKLFGRIVRSLILFVLKMFTDVRIFGHLKAEVWRRGGLMVSALDSALSGPGSSPGRGHCVVFLGKTLYSYSDGLASHPGGVAILLAASC